MLSRRLLQSARPLLNHTINKTFIKQSTAAYHVRAFTAFQPTYQSIRPFQSVNHSVSQSVNAIQQNNALRIRSYHHLNRPTAQFKSFNPVTSRRLLARSLSTQSSTPQSNPGKPSPENQLVDAKPNQLANADQPTRAARIWQKVKDEAHHYWHGTKLLVTEVKITIKLVRRVLNGHELNRRERKQLTRTSADLLRLVPFLVIVLIPFMEFALPLILKFFPNMLPSTYVDHKGEAAKVKKQLAAKVEMARFLQDTTALMAEQLMSHTEGESEERRLTVESFQHLMDKVKNGESVQNNEILMIAPLFDEDFTLDHLNREQLAAMCRLLDIRVFGSEWVLRHKLTRKLDALRDDDKAIDKEGIDSLTDSELREACRARGIHSNQSTAYMKRKLADWLELSLEHDVPISLLVLSRAFSQSLASGRDTQLSEDLATTLKHIPDVVVKDTQATIVELSNDPEQKLKLIMDEDTQAVESQEKKKDSKKEKVKNEIAVGLTELKEQIEDAQEENDEIEEEIDEAIANKETSKAAPSTGVPASADAGAVATVKPINQPAREPSVEKKKVRKVDILNDQVENLLDRVHVELEQHLKESNEQAAAEAAAAVSAVKPESEQSKKEMKQ